jgi:hypothetical protein
MPTIRPRCIATIATAALIAYLAMTCVGAEQFSAGQQRILHEAAVTFPMEEGLVLRGYSNRKEIAEPATVAHAIVLVHGVLRNPEHYYMLALQSLQRKRLATKVALVAVGFDDRQSAPAGVPHLALFDKHWKHGGFGGSDAADSHNHLSSFAAMDRILADLAKSYPALTRITLIGHSAGAQFLDRYSALDNHWEYLPKIHVRFVALAPSTLLYPSDARPIVAANGAISFAKPADTCGGEYNQYPYGLETTPLLDQLMKSHVATRQRLVDRLLHRDMILAVGTQDITSQYLDRSCEANTQGASRFPRAKSFVDFLRATYGTTGVRFLPIRGAGHGSKHLLQSSEMREFFSER